MCNQCSGVRRTVNTDKMWLTVSSTKRQLHGLKWPWCLCLYCVLQQNQLVDSFLDSCVSVVVQWVRRDSRRQQIKEQQWIYHFAAKTRQEKRHDAILMWPSRTPHNYDLRKCCSSITASRLVFIKFVSQPIYFVCVYVQKHCKHSSESYHKVKRFNARKHHWSETKLPVLLEVCSAVNKLTMGCSMSSEGVFQSLLWFELLLL